MISVDLINPFISAAQKVLKEMCQTETVMEKPYLNQAVYSENSLVIIIGVTGQMKGQVILSMKFDIACKLASKMMMGMPVDELNDMAKSAISELSNMILGNAATIFSKNGITLDITPPSLCLGENLSISVSNTKNICVPLSFEENVLDINISIKEN